MDAALWQEVQAVFADVVDLPEAARASHLARVCAGRSDLFAEVESLLQAHQRAGAFIEPVPDRIGPYRLLEEIGHGGMGAVYRASRDDGQFQQQVAVKLLSLPGSASGYRRFLDEQQILANLSHPNIAALLDGGITRSGVSYIVMEYIDGLRIDRYAQGRPVLDRLRLFRAVCAAVHYAHQNLVVHRDLKPANILVTREGVAKLLDFGIAKILAPDRRTAGTTVFPAMTPEYASPEQVRGAPISTASDVYSLGLLLHELLTGRRPYDLGGKAYDEIVRIICEQPLEKPRTGSDDLDAIIAKAMRKAPVDRYPSAEALSSDIDRYLGNRPVDARQGAVWYVLTRFLSRHRVAAATAAIVAIVLAAAVTITVRESRIAERRFQDVRTLASSVIFDIHDAVATLPGSTAARKLIVSNAVEHLDKLSHDAGGDPALQRELGDAYVRLGDVQGLQSQANLGDPEGAIASYQKARALLREAVRRRPADSRATVDLAEACRHLGLVLTFVRRSEDAQQAVGESVTRLEALVRRDPSDLHRRKLASAYSSMSDVLENRLDYRRKAMQIFEDVLAKQPQDPDRRREVALVHKNIASVLLPIKYGDEALPHLQRAEDLDAARLAASPTSREAQMDLSFDYSQNGTYYLNRELFESALANYRKALEIRLRLAESDPADARLRDRLVYAYSMIGQTSMYLRKPREALEAYGESKRLSEKLLAGAPGHPQYRSNLAKSQYGVGEAEQALGHAHAACAAWHAASTVFGNLKTEGKLRTDETRMVEELRTRLASCSGGELR
jgi:eukaryotic-like serine/threonine-protein kinase